MGSIEKGRRIKMGGLKDGVVSKIRIYTVYARGTVTNYL